MNVDKYMALATLDLLNTTVTCQSCSEEYKLSEDKTFKVVWISRNVAETDSPMTCPHCGTLQDRYS